jgi:hypothetical protein
MTSYSVFPLIQTESGWGYQKTAPKVLSETNINLLVRAKLNTLLYPTGSFKRSCNLLPGTNAIGC